MEIEAGLHHLRFPLLPGIFGSLNLLLGSRDAGLVDTGTPPQPDLTLLPYMEQANIDPARISVIVNTHWHGDHMGGNAQMVGLTRASVSAHRQDVAWIERPIEAVHGLRQRYGKYHPAWGQSDEEITRTLPPGSKVDRVLEDGDQIAVGDRAFRVVHTPGHTPGSISLLDRGAGLVLTGDGLQGGGQLGSLPIYTDLDPYLAAIEKIEAMDAGVLVTAHIYPPFDGTVHRGRDIRRFLDLCRENVDRLDTQVMEVLGEDRQRPRILGDVVAGVMRLSGLEGPVGLGIMCVAAHLDRLTGRGTLRRLPSGPDGAADERSWTSAVR